MAQSEWPNQNSPMGIAQLEWPNQNGGPIGIAQLEWPNQNSPIRIAQLEWSNRNGPIRIAQISDIKAISIETISRVNHTLPLTASTIQTKQV